jgi:hypothetical protein
VRSESSDWLARVWNFGIYILWLLGFLWAAGPEFGGGAGLRGIGDGERCNVPVPAIPDGDNISPDLIPVGSNFVPSPSPNRGIPHGESGIGSPLPSLRATRPNAVFYGSTPSPRVRILSPSVSKRPSIFRIPPHCSIHLRFCTKRRLFLGHQGAP